MADMDPMMRIADEHGLVVIEDAAQAIGAEYKGRRAGSIGHYGCFSFFPSKNLGAAGDGGMIVTNDARAGRESYGASAATDPNRSTITRWSGAISVWMRIQAAIVSAKLPHLDDLDGSAPAQRQEIRSAVRRGGPADCRARLSLQIATFSINT